MQNERKCDGVVFDRPVISRGRAILLATLIAWGAIASIDWMASARGQFILYRSIPYYVGVK